MDYPQQCLMVSPQHFDVKYAINPHMKTQEGTLQKVFKPLALYQWETLSQRYAELGVEVHLLDGHPQLPDMVFAANQTFPYIKEGEKRVILSRMSNPERRPEVEHFRKFFLNQGYKIQELPPEFTFEGNGDGLWDFPTETLYLGYGFRTSKQAVSRVQSLVGARTIPLRLVDDRFYHLDTCLCLLGKGVAAYVREAFDQESFLLLRESFQKLIPLHLDEALNFAGNAHCPDGVHVLLQKGNPLFEADLVAHGYTPIPVDTSEFMKAGGSVFCLKMMFF